MFAKVAEEGSYAAASRALGVSVPTVSRAVARLEERLGARLFNRTSRQLSLTEFGQGMVEQASALYRQAEAMESEAQELSLQHYGVLGSDSRVRTFPSSADAVDAFEAETSQAPV